MSSLPRTVKSSLAKSLRDEILLGELIPGQHLRLEEIAGRYEISTTPVREALRELEAEGLVTIFPHRGAVVTELSADELQDIYDIRATLEEMATRLAVPHMNENVLAELLAYIEEMDSHIGELVTLVKLNHKFHITLYAASGRRHLCELTSMLRFRTQHYLHAFITYMGGMPQAQIDHRAILAACREKDADRAAALIHEHVIHVGQAIIAHIHRGEAEVNSE